MNDQRLTDARILTALEAMPAEFISGFRQYALDEAEDDDQAPDMASVWQALAIVGFDEECRSVVRALEALDPVALAEVRSGWRTQADEANRSDNVRKVAAAVADLGDEIEQQAADRVDR